TFIDPTNTTGANNVRAGDIWSVVYQGAMLPDFPDGIIHIFGDAGYQRSVDGGRTWSVPRVPPGGTGQGSLAISPDEPYVVFVVVANKTTVAGKIGNNKLYESDDEGQTWTELGNPKPQGRVPFVATSGGGGTFNLWFGDVNLF